VIELGDPVDVRSFLDHLERAHPGTELVARRKRDRSPLAGAPVRRSEPAPLRATATDAQAAYYGGFFEWPREHTGEEVAESIGISQPTFSRHLRL